MFSSTGLKDTLRNIRTTKEFVLNIVTMDVFEEMMITSTDFPPEEDEFDWSGLTPVPSVKVAPPRIEQAKAHLECVLVDEITLGNAMLVFGRVVYIHVDPSVWRNGRVDAELLDPVCRLSGSGYAPLGEQFRLPIPKWEDVATSEPRRAKPR
jgi:flavin reductase (DIM6/NTAB) family NADH-FMN oxidoreductase RutF